MTSFQGKLRIRHLEIVLAVAERGNLSKASAQMHMTQSGLSRAIAEIEEIVGGRLFERSAKGTSCTPLGLTLCKHASVLLGDFGKAEADLHAVSSGDIGNLTIGCFSMFGGWPLADAVREFRISHPHVSVTVEVGTHERLIKDLDSATIDVLISRFVPALNADAYRSVSLLDDGILLVSSVDHPLVSRSKISLADCVRYPWITPLPGTRLLSEIHTLIKRSNLELPPMVSGLSLDFGSEMIRDDNYLWLLPASVAAVMQSKNIVRILPVPLDLIRSPLAAIWRRDRSSTREVRAFAAVISKIIRDDKAALGF